MDTIDAYNDLCRRERAKKAAAIKTVKPARNVAEALTEALEQHNSMLHAAPVHSGTVTLTGDVWLVELRAEHFSQPLPYVVAAVR